MKKFYAIAAAAMTALSMNAQLYVVGAGEGLAWEPTDPMVVELENGAYTFEINDLTQFQISTELGNWDTFNTAKYMPTAALTEENLGTAVELALGGEGNISTPWKGDYKVVVAGDLSTITLTTDTPKPDPNAAKEIYLRGGMNEWGSPAEWMFSHKEGNDYYFVCKDATMIPAGTSLKIADADWNVYNYGANGPITIDDESWWNYNDQDSLMTEDFEGTVYITLPEEERGELTVLFKSGVFENSAVETIAVANGEAEYFNLQGVRVANPAQGLYIVRQGGVVT
ncbi:MAG: hypothetical protein K2M14_05270, partial [Muribaculaceae bacterium]|nr:hypothetical protein [Muribaculaceae bacterium]